MKSLEMNEHIGKICQQYRLKNNLTQNEVAELTGLGPRHILHFIDYFLSK